MNLAALHQKLLAAARKHPPAETVPYAFEKRIMALLAKSPVVDRWAMWARALWRAAAPCAAVMVLLCAWSLLAPSNPPPSNDLSQDLENTVLAAMDPDPPADPVW